MHLMVPLLPISYMKPLLMLLEGECYTYTYGGVLFLLSSMEAGSTPLHHRESEQRSSAWAPLLKEKLSACL